MSSAGLARRPPPSRPRPARHCLAVRLDNAGDVLLAGPAVRAIAAACGRVTMLAGPRGAAAARLLPGVDEVVVWRAPWVDLDPLRVRPEMITGLAGRLAAQRFTEAVIFTSFHQSPLPTALVLRLARHPPGRRDQRGLPVVAARRPATRRRGRSRAGTGAGPGPRGRLRPAARGRREARRPAAAA